MTDISIYISYFKAAHVIKSKSLIPIQTGRDISGYALPMIGDSEGENISGKNESYCELTGHYWAWKNGGQSGYIGFMHYRRLFDFNNAVKRRALSSAGTVDEERLTDNVLLRYAIDDESIRNCIEKYDMVLPVPWDVSPTAANLRDQYGSSPGHHVDDLNRAGEIIEEICPEYYVDFLSVMESRCGYFNNMFIFKRKIFNEYSEWLFPILEVLESYIHNKSYTGSENRAIGYVAERLLNVFVAHKTRINSGLSILHLRRVFIKNTTEYGICPDVPRTALPVVSIIAATDKCYAGHAGAMISSVLSNASRERFIDIIILDGGLTEQDKRELWFLERLHPESSIRFIDMSLEFLEVKTHGYFSRPTLYRLALADIVTNRDKVLYLDVDTICLQDVAPLFDTDLCGRSLGAVQDFIMSAFAVRGVPSPEFCGSIATMEYLRDYLGLGARYCDYFQAGVIIFDLKRIRDSGISRDMTADLKSRRYWFLDQDVLNKHFMSDVFYLSNKWNCVLLPDELKTYLPENLTFEYSRSRESPAIIHFAGNDKPWKVVDAPYAHYYWYYLRMTLFYEKVLMEWRVPAGRKVAPARRLAHRFMSRVWRAVPNVIRRALMPVAVVMYRQMGVK